jgi:Fe-S cluster assembly ATP-binding protein
MLEVVDLAASVDTHPILKGVNLSLGKGQVHGIMGPNGSGKSTLAKVLAGDPSYEVTGGTVRFNGADLLDMAPDERAKAGVFLAFQYPLEIPGVRISEFLRTAYNAVSGEELSTFKFYNYLQDKIKELQLDDMWSTRYVNEGFSGGEKKRNEILQMMVLQPKLCILDETDSGLDVDALKVVSEGVNKMRSPDRSLVIVTHYMRLLDYIKPDVCHVMLDGRIVMSGDIELARQIDQEGYDFVRSQTEEPATDV